MSKKNVLLILIDYLWIIKPIYLQIIRSIRKCWRFFRFYKVSKFLKIALKSDSPARTEIRLPNGMKIFCLQREEVFPLYKQVEKYFGNGIIVSPGDIVFDVGANIGLFTLLTFHKCKQDVDIYAFEPIPAIFDVLNSNAKYLNSEKIRSFSYGLSDESKKITFAWFCNASMLSTQYNNVNDLKSLRRELRRCMLQNMTDAPRQVRWMWVLPFSLKSFLIDKILERTFKIKEVTCQVKTLSEIISEENIKRIDLLKIDVEKSELDVLRGIQEQDWPKIQQIVVEIHDIGGRVKKIENLLFKHGFKTKIEQEPFFEDSEVFNLYAQR